MRFALLRGRAVVIVVACLFSYSNGFQNQLSRRWNGVATRCRFSVFHPHMNELGRRHACIAPISQNPQAASCPKEHRRAVQASTSKASNLDDGNSRNKSSIFVRCAGMFAAVGAIVVGVKYFRPDLSSLEDVLYKQLDDLNNAGLVGLIIYTVTLWIWTVTVGVTTPVETAAGFCFGFEKAAIASSIGKVGGAFTAFSLGRLGWLKKKATNQVRGNELLQLVNEQIRDYPLLVAIGVRCAPLPELAKNLGMSMLDLPFAKFAISVTIHGVVFSLLWSCMGAESAHVLRGGRPSRKLRMLVTGISWFSFLFSPALLGAWVKNLRCRQQEHVDLSQSSAGHRAAGGT